MKRSPAQIRRTLAVAEQRIIEWRERRAVLRRDLVRAVAREQKVFAMYEGGHPYSTIGKRIGVTRQMIYQILHPEVRRRRDGRS